MFNPITKKLPASLTVAGISVPIDTGFRIWVQIWKIRESNKDGWKKAFAILTLAYPSKEYKQLIANNYEEALSKALDFLNRTLGNDEPERPPTRSEKRLKGLRLLDWDHDASRVVSDFMREYGIDLTDGDLTMHWWRFMALFNGLSDQSATMEAIAIRAADIDDKNLSGDAKRRLRERKTSLMLPARSKEEAAQNRRLLRGC